MELVIVAGCYRRVEEGASGVSDCGRVLQES